MSRAVLSLTLCCFFFLLGCAKPSAEQHPFDVKPLTQVSIPSLEGKRVLVVSPLSQQKVESLDVDAVIAQTDAKLKAEGKGETSGLTKAVTRRVPVFLQAMAKFPGVLVNSLQKSGVIAKDSERIQLDTGSEPSMLTTAAAKAGFDYVLVVGVETPLAKGRKIFNEERHTAKNIATKIVSLGLAPVHSSTFSLNYQRTVTLHSCQASQEPLQKTFVTSRSYDETVNSLTHGFGFAERFTRDLGKSQIQDAHDILRWLAESLPTR